MANDDLDLEAARRLADDLSSKLAQSRSGDASYQALRDEVEALRSALGSTPVQHSWIADRLKSIEGHFERAAVELLADGIKAGAYLAEIARIIGAR